MLNKGIWEIFKFLFVIGSQTLNLLFIEFPVFLFNLSKIAYSFIKSVISKIKYHVYTEAISGAEDIEVHEVPKTRLPKPKIRKNKIESEERKALVVERRDDSKAKKELGEKTLARILKSKKNVDFSDYELPSVKLLKESEVSQNLEDDNILREKSKLIEDKLKDFGVKGQVTHVHPGPVITLFEFEPAAGVKVGKIASLQDDLAMSLKANSIRVIAPIPGRGTVGIELPNPKRDLVRLRDVLECEEYVNADSTLSIPLGKDIYGSPIITDIALMPHLLMAGATGTGKSVCLNALLLSLLYRASPADLGLILIDPKILELSVYEGIPHLKAPIVTVPKQARAVLQWAVKEMDRRYHLMQKYGVRNIDNYNEVARGDTPIEKEEMEHLSKIVIVVDELADLMLSVGKDIEDLIARLAQKARAAGIHLILATQRPSVDVITGLIKANFPARVSFRVSSRIDSRTILDSMGAEKLLGRGDMLFMPPGSSNLQRIHGAYVSDNEVSKIVASIKKQANPNYDEEIVNACEKALGELEYDSLYDKSVELVVQKGQASTSMLQRAFRIGYNRAARIVDTMESEGIVGPMEGSKAREVLLNQEFN
ncbi:UNVERIFIED_CONTAM: hypothetical protein GTU68_000333 [Idotea baltica]|nr:hypothetical protein [Idotea baltica]